MTTILKPLKFSSIAEVITFQLNILKNTHFDVLHVCRKIDSDKQNRAKCLYKLTLNRILDNLEEFKNINRYHHCDIYIKPIPSYVYNMIIDDIRPTVLEKMLSLLSPELIILSSTDNYQAVFNLDMKDYTKEQADILTRKLNKMFGDPRFCGVTHFFRLAGFHNKKPKNHNELVSLFICSQTKDNKSFFDNLLNGEVLNKENKGNLYLPLSSNNLTDDKRLKAKKIILNERKLCSRIFSTLDASAVDFRIAKRLKKSGFSKEEVISVFNYFIDVEQRHANPIDYLIRTIHKAFE